MLCFPAIPEDNRVLPLLPNAPEGQNSQVVLYFVLEDQRLGEPGFKVSFLLPLRRVQVRQPFQRATSTQTLWE